MKKYEYKIVLANSMMAQDQMNQFGDEGWLLCQAVPFQGNIIFIFARETATDEAVN